MGMSRSFRAVSALLFIATLVLSQSAPAQKSNSESAEKGFAAELPRIPPKTPGEALKAFRLHPGFRIELAAAEPLLASPVAIDFDEDGRLYVAEFREFNQGASRQPHGRGQVRLLEEQEFSAYNFEYADPVITRTLFELHEKEAKQLLDRYRKVEEKSKNRFPLLAAYDHCLKCSHLFNLLDSRGVISTTERAQLIGRVRQIACRVAADYLGQQTGAATSEAKQ